MDEQFDDNNLVSVQESLVGELHTMCSIPEAQLRTETRQVDRFELAPGASSSDVRIDMRKAIKKYQRSSADKKYSSIEVRTVKACWDTVEYLVSNVLDFDINPKPGYAEACCTNSSYFEIYSFLRDRLRAVRVDLHVQNASSDHLFITIHEICLRFELLSLFLLWGRNFGTSDDRKFDLHMSLTALSQTIDPLANAYRKRREESRDAKISSEELEKEAEITSYVLLLSLTSRGGSKTFKSHYLKQPAEIKSHPAVTKAYQTVSDFYSGNWVQFLERFSTSSYLSACCLLPVVHLARCRVLWRVVRTNRPFFVRKEVTAGPMPPPRPEKVSVARMTELLGFKTENECNEFLSYFGLNAEVGLPPRQLTKNPITWWLSSAEWRSKANDSRDFPDYLWAENDVENFHRGVGEDVGDDNPPDRCECPKRVEIGIEKKYNEQLNRKSIVMGSNTSPPTPEISRVVPLPGVISVGLGLIGPTPTFFPEPPAAPPKPERPFIALEPLVVEVPKRTRESPDKTTLPVERPPSKKLHEISALSVPAEPVPLPTLPAIESGFDVLAMELSQIVISRNMKSPEIFYDIDKSSSREDEISERRRKYIALKCLQLWRNINQECRRWKWLIGTTNRAPARINP